MMRAKRKSFTVERRLLGRKGGPRGKYAVQGYSDRVEQEFAAGESRKCLGVDIGMIAEDVARLLRGRSGFPREIYEEAR